MIGAVILAAGLSRRMGTPKMLLPWGSTTVLGRVIEVIQQAGVDPIVVVTGGAHEAVERSLAGTPVSVVLNPRFQQDEMAYSLQVGLAALPESVLAALVGLGDQPQIQPEAVAAVVSAYPDPSNPLIIPSYQMRRGHPWLIDRSLWPAVMAIRPPATLRDFLNAHSRSIRYITVETDSVLRDLDTPEDYQREKPTGKTSGIEP